ncbi:MAG: serine/threonine protein kinase, partial [Pseudomonadota bacterium]|nr:serine/threonine protein kinase [Pseudomonadota bacterium]
MNSIIYLCSHLFSLRLLVFVLAVVLALAGDQLAAFSWADRVLLGLLGVPDAESVSVPIPVEAVSATLAARELAEPAWSGLAMRISLLVAALYLVLAIPRMGATVALPVTL